MDCMEASNDLCVDFEETQWLTLGQWGCFLDNVPKLEKIPRSLACIVFEDPECLQNHKTFLSLGKFIHIRDCCQNSLLLWNKFEQNKS